MCRERIRNRIHLLTNVLIEFMSRTTCFEMFGKRMKQKDFTLLHSIEII